MKIQTIIDYLNEIYQPRLQEDYDNAGLLAGDTQQEISGALVALDLRMEVVEEAQRIGANLIVTHHPFIFTGVKRITPQNEVGRLIRALVKADICVYAAHTNLDNLKHGVNGILSEKLGMKNCEILKPIAGTEEVGAGMIGEVEECGTREFLERVKGVLGLSVMRCSELCRETVKRVAICGGAGSFLIEEAARKGADVYLTGDMKYHDFQRAEGRMVIGDVGHYESEQFAEELIYLDISKKFSNFATRIAAKKTNYIEYI